MTKLGLEFKKVQSDDRTRYITFICTLKKKQLLKVALKTHEN